MYYKTSDKDEKLCKSDKDIFYNWIFSNWQNSVVLQQVIVMEKYANLTDIFITAYFQNGSRWKKKYANLTDILFITGYFQTGRTHSCITRKWKRSKNTQSWQIFFITAYFQNGSRSELRMKKYANLTGIFITGYFHNCSSWKLLMKKICKSDIFL